MRARATVWVIGYLLPLISWFFAAADEESDTGVDRHRVIESIKAAVPGYAEQTAFMDAASRPLLDPTPIHDAVVAAVGEWDPQRGFERLASRRDIVLPLAIVALEDASLGEERHAYVGILEHHFWLYGDARHDPWLARRTTDALLHCYVEGDARLKERILGVMRLYLNETDIVEKIHRKLKGIQQKDEAEERHNDSGRRGPEG